MANQKLISNDMFSSSHYTVGCEETAVLYRLNPPYTRPPPKGSQYGYRS